MKKFFFLLIAAISFQFATAQTIGNYMLALESNLKRDALTDQWNNQWRADWLTQCKEDKQQAAIMCLAHLEANINHDQFSSTWETDLRGTWLQDLKMAPDQKALAKLLMQLEQNLLPDAFTTTWKDAKPTWIKNVDLLQQ